MVRADYGSNRITSLTVRNRRRIPGPHCKGIGNDEEPTLPAEHESAHRDLREPGIHHPVSRTPFRDNQARGEPHYSSGPFPARDTARSECCNPVTRVNR